MKRTINIVAVTACLALSGCSVAAHSGVAFHAAASPTPLSPADALQASVPAMAAVTYNVRISGDGTTEIGSIDPIHKAAQVVVSSPLDSHQNMTMSNRDVAGKVYLKIDVGSANAAMHLNPKVWMAIDTSKLDDGVALPLNSADATDPLDLDGLLQAVTSVHRIDAVHYAGVMDLTKNGGTLGSDSDELTKAGAKARSVPFTATLDASGRLLNLTIDASAADKALSMKVVISDYGTGDSVAIPAASTVKSTPAAVYSMLNG